MGVWSEVHKYRANGGLKSRAFGARSAVLGRREIPYLWGCGALHWRKCGVSLWAGPSNPGHSGRCWRCHIDFVESGASTAKLIVLDLLFLPRLLSNVCSHSSVSSTFVAMLSYNRNVLILSCVGKGYHKKEWTNQKRTDRPTRLAFNMAVRQGILITEIYYSVSYLKLCH